MTYTPLTDPARIKDCFEAFGDRFGSGTQVVGAKPGGHAGCPSVLWHAKLGIWSCFGDNWGTYRRKSGEGDWFAVFGIGSPTNERPKVELKLNVYKDEAVQRVDGRYFTDNFGKLYVGRTRTGQSAPDATFSETPIAKVIEDVVPKKLGKGTASR